MRQPAYSLKSDSELHPRVLLLILEDKTLCPIAPDEFELCGHVFKRVEGSPDQYYLECLDQETVTSVERQITLSRKNPTFVQEKDTPDASLLEMVEDLGIHVDQSMPGFGVFYDSDESPTAVWLKFVNVAIDAGEYLLGGKVFRRIQHPDFQFVCEMSSSDEAIAFARKHGNNPGPQPMVQNAPGLLEQLEQYAEEITPPDDMPLMEFLDILGNEQSDEGIGSEMDAWKKAVARAKNKKKST